jgi:hypothetical protein
MRTLFVGEIVRARAQVSTVRSALSALWAVRDGLTQRNLMALAGIVNELEYAQLRYRHCACVCARTHSPRYAATHSATPWRSAMRATAARRVARTSHFVRMRIICRADAVAPQQIRKTIANASSCVMSARSTSDSPSTRDWRLTFWLRCRASVMRATTDRRRRTAAAGAIGDRRSAPSDALRRRSGDASCERSRDACERRARTGCVERHARHALARRRRRYRTSRTRARVCA